MNILLYSALQHCPRGWEKLLFLLKKFQGLNTFLVPYIYDGVHIGPLLKKRCI